MYKILRLYNYLPFVNGYKKLFISEKLKNKSYEEELRTYRKNFLMFPNLFCEEFEKLGVKANDILFTNKGIQKKWCREKGIKIDFFSKKWWFEVLQKQIEFYKPDVLYLERTCCLNILTNEYRDIIRNKYPYIKLIVGFWGSQIEDKNQLEVCKNLDFIFCGDQYLLNQIKIVNNNTAVLHHCFDYNVDSPQKINKKYGCNFIGYSGFLYQDHMNRYYLLDDFLRNDLIKAWLLEESITMKQMIKNQIIKAFAYMPENFLKQRLSFENKFNILNKCIKRGLEYKLKDSKRMFLYEKPLKKKYEKIVNSPVFGKEYLKVIKSSKIVLNIHVNDINHYGNMRCFEVTGMGSCLLTDRPSLMKDLFVPDEEVATYSCKEEAKEKIIYLLNNPSVREEIARRGQKKTLDNYTTYHRCLKIHKKISEIISNPKREANTLK